ncbi:hypothetical protein JTB14_011154 [Gonioctena quinquepunctata]|nr:hypothetical protein JTB14_011154 [Gonioctena quinquepunctata]
MLRIKSLSELMDTSLKCSRNEEDNNETYGKLLRVDLSKIEVGETNEEPLNESINDLGEIKNNSKVTEVPSKLGDVCNDVKTGNNICNSSPNLSEKLKKDGEHCNQNSNEMDISNVNILEPQKNIFFFGAPSQSNSLCPSLTMGFGKVSQMNDVLENKDSDGETTKISESKAHGKFGTQISKRVEPVEDLFHGESESLPKKSKRKEVSEKEENTTNKIIPKVNIPEKKSAEISIRIKKLLPTKAKDVQTEEVYVKGRRELQTKNTEASPRTIVPKKNKMAVTTKKKNKGKAESLVEKDSHTTSLNEKGIAVSPNSSQISSSLSITDSISTFPEPLGNNSVEDKDPLAESDQEVTTSKPMNLQSFSFDFNESSTVPQIPVDSKRMLRKREREASPAANPMQNVEIKRKKLKGKRQINTKLRKSIELLKEQQVSSSDEDIINIPDDNSKGKKSLLKHKKKKVIASKKKEESLVTISDDSNSTPYFPPKSRKQNKENGDHETRHSDNKNKRLLAGLNVSDIQLSGVRQSRRLAQIKIKEQVEDKKPEPSAKEEKEKKTKNKSITSGKLKKHKPIILSIEPVQKHEVTKKKKKKSKLPNKIFDEHRPWKSSSGSSEEEGEEEVEDEEEIVEEELPLEFLSDHEFSPESDLGSADEYQPLKRARTAKRKYEDDSVEAEKKEEDFPCQKCGKSDHPEMVLLCDKCDNGWHCSCLRPPILSIPEGDWFCPPCQHVKLVENLHDKLTEYDKKLTKKGLEDRRKERLAYVGISLNNVLPSREKEQQKNYLSSSVESQSSASDLESSSDEPIYQLRQRRQAKSYKFNEYDELIKSAIQDELNEKRDKDSPCRGKDMATIVKAEGEDRKEEEELEKKKKQTSTEDNPDSIVEPKPEKSNSEDDIIKAPVNILKKKARRICSLDLSSEEDDERDEDFKGSSSSSEDDDFENESEDSDEFLLGKKRKNLRPLRRSTRARVSRFDADFLDDDEEDDIPKKKKKPQYFSESDSSDDTSWKKKKWSHCAKKKTSRKKKKIFEELSDLDIAKKKKPKIKYGGLTSSEEEMGRGRRTRGKKTTYVDTLGSDSEEECRKKNFGSDNEDDEDFVANEEDEKDSEEIPEDLVNDDDDEKENEKIQKNPIIKENLVHIEQKSNTNNCERTENLTKHLKEQKLKVTGEEFITSEKSKTTEILKRAKEEKEMLSLPHHEISRSLSSKLEDDNKCYYEENSYLSGNPTDDSQKKSENLAPGDTKRIMEEDYTNTNLESVMVQIEKKKKRKAAEDKTKDLQSHPHFDERTQPVEKGRQTESKSLERIKHRPIITNVRNMIKNYDSNEELSEPPMGVSLPLFEELASKGTDESNKKKRERGKGNKKTLEETVGDLVEKKKTQPDISQSTIPNIEIAAPPQPFSQDDPTPSTITRMLQTKPEQTTTYPIGSIRPKRFATMPDDDDESPSNKSKSRGSSPTIAPPRMDGSPSGDYMIG